MKFCCDCTNASWYRAAALVGIGLIVSGTLGAGAAMPADPGPPSPRRLTSDGLDKQRPVWSSDGRRLLFARHEADGSQIRLYWLDPEDPQGALKRLTDRKTPEYNAAVSPDGKHVLYVAITLSGTQGNLDIEVSNADGTAARTVVGDHAGKLSHQDWPSWSPDGKRFAFSSTHDGNQEIYVANIDDGEMTRLTQHPGQDMHPCWSPKGDVIAFATDRWGGMELALVHPDGTGLERLTTSPGLDDYPAFAPAGDALAFVSNRDANYEIYVRRLDSETARNYSRHPGRDTFPTWTRDGRGITFLSDRDGAFDLYTMDVSSTPAESKR